MGTERRGETTRGGRGRRGEGRAGKKRGRAIDKNDGDKKAFPAANEIGVGVYQ